jgi:hypothetical protein
MTDELWSDRLRDEFPLVPLSLAALPVHMMKMDGEAQRLRYERPMNPTNPYHTPASLPPLEAPMSRDTRVLVWVAGLLFCATVSTAIADVFACWLR